MTEAAPWRIEPGSLVLHVRLTPKGGRDAVEGIERLSDGRSVLKARVRAVPEDGKANDALLRLIATLCGVPARSVALTGGATSRLKTLRIEGDPNVLATTLSSRFAT
jgi:uncharacterized protein YggU (UPF0235/DUF167 family)